MKKKPTKKQPARKTANEKELRTVHRLEEEIVHEIEHEHKHHHKKHKAVKGSVTLKFGKKRGRVMAKQGQSGLATAAEFDQNGAPFTIAHPDGLQWSASDGSIAVAATGDGTPTAKVTIGAATPAGDYTVTFADPDAPSLQVSPGTFTVEAAQTVPTTGSVTLGEFA